MYTKKHGNYVLLLLRFTSHKLFSIFSKVLENSSNVTFLKTFKKSGSYCSIRICTPIAKSFNTQNTNDDVRLILAPKIIVANLSIQTALFKLALCRYFAEPSLKRTFTCKHLFPTLLLNEIIRPKQTGRRVDFPSISSLHYLLQRLLVCPYVTIWSFEEP